MLYSQRQPIKTRQNNVTLLAIKINGVLATPIADGWDKKFISSVEDIGAGNYKITFRDKAKRALEVLGHEVFTDGLYLRVTASDTESVTVLIKTFAGVATDGAFGLTIGFHQDATLY